MTDWLRYTSSYEFGWYVEEDVVFTGHWRNIFKLRVRGGAAAGHGWSGVHDGMEVNQDLVAHITRASRTWKKPCIMPGKMSCKSSVGGGVFKTKWRGRRASR